MRTRLVLRSCIALATVAIGLAACQDRTPATITGPGEPRYQQVQATPIVNNQSDTGDGTCDDDYTGDGCTLREAIAYASSGATITFASAIGGSIFLSSASGQLLIDKDLTIEGPGATHLSIRASGSRVVRVDPGATVHLSGLGFSNGSSTYNGGGIFNAGTLTLTDCYVGSDTSTGRNGGGIANGGTDAGVLYQSASLTLIRTIVTGNYAAQRGGGVFNYNSRLIVDRSTIMTNASDLGAGGITSLIESGDTTTTYTHVINSTIAANTGPSGAGLNNEGGLTRVSFSTIADNVISSGSGGGIYNNGKTELRGNIVFGNLRGTAADDIAAAASGVGIVSLGGNVVGTGGTNVDLSTVFTQPGDQSGVNPLLGAAPTGDTLYTRSLQSGSPAIDVTRCIDAVGDTVATDQRGESRPQHTACDAGAYERTYVAPPPTFSSSCTYTSGTNGRNTVTVAWRLADPGVTQVSVSVGGRATKKSMSPTAADTISVKTAGGTPTYNIYAGTKRGDTSTQLVTSGSCTGP